MASVVSRSILRNIKTESEKGYKIACRKLFKVSFFSFYIFACSKVNILNLFYVNAAAIYNRFSYFLHSLISKFHAKTEHFIEVICKLFLNTCTRFLFNFSNDNLEMSEYHFVTKKGQHSLSGGRTHNLRIWTLLLCDWTMVRTTEKQQYSSHSFFLFYISSFIMYI